ncbi:MULTISPECIES: DUF6092 family protein [Clostridium]|uniref:Uncharacterized protein n=1 Tax=Clostridium coskatii TaxID=1705578 RepID=A0A168PND3_9CLOT|nr:MULTISPECIES: DUF6092 family protein [Clostridium]OAA87954.1 hypothetical protein WX73_02649 [Clostridium coskatii]OBR97589.1 hypothetical protein CLCOS_01800 [Clostridium coskatii]QXE18042.1 hypothetical protein B5S50_03840 [Clostridium sp. 001]
MNEKLIELLAYIVSSAVGCLNEPKIYGSLRLIDTTQKIIELFNELNLVEDENLNKIANIINEEKSLCMSDDAAFEKMLNSVSDKLVQLIVNEGK